MVVEITAIHLAGGIAHEHIEAVRWRNSSTQEMGQSTRKAMVDWLSMSGNQAYVTDGRNTVSVGVVQTMPPYIRTHADSKWTDNLLALRDSSSWVKPQQVKKCLT